MNASGSPLLSILIPVYNVKPFLEECLTSIQNQKFSDFEAICINDGSTDGSLELLQQFADNDARFRIINKENTGYGHSMNIGLSESKGKFIGIVEPDDYIEPEMFDILVALAEKHQLDIARSAYYRFSAQEKTAVDLSAIPENTVFRPLDCLDIFYQAPSVWANIYRRQLLIQNNIRFLETPGASFQDLSFTFKVYACCKRFMLVNKPLINYRIDNLNSSIHDKGKVFCVCTEFDEILRFVKAEHHQEIYEKTQYIIPDIRFNNYAWNFSRISNEFRMPFLKKWAEHIQSDFDEKRIQWRIIGLKRLKKMWFIRFFPLRYKWRKRGL